MVMQKLLTVEFHFLSAFLANFRHYLIEKILLRDVPSYGFYIIAYEWLFDKVCDRKKGELPSPFQTVWVGGVAG